MKRRYLYVLLFGVPILLASTIVTAVVVGAAAGALWLFVAGDDPWPPFADDFLTALIVLVFAASSLALAHRAYVLGKRREADATLDTRHVMAAAGAAVLLLLVALVHQWRVGNIGAKSDSVVCAEFCVGRGFAGSSMPPRDAGAPTCGCIDAQGREVEKVPMEDLAARH